jgi:hypothetical protein
MSIAYICITTRIVRSSVILLFPLFVIQSNVGIYFLFCFYTIQFDWVTKKKTIRQVNVLPGLSLLLLPIDEIKVVSHQTLLIERHNNKKMDKNTSTPPQK